MGAPTGNQNAAKARVWTAAIERAMETKSRLEGKAILDEAAGKLVELALAGDLSALKELGDRLEGKAAQGITLAGSLSVKTKKELSDDELASIIAAGGSAGAASEAQG
jgi:hypothetical protein